ncbi:MAG: FHA domain-containing protein [Planctomycetota bacterium]|nr:FHA domain-containing protein [Planctomycetota bacterium]
MPSCSLCQIPFHGSDQLCPDCRRASDQSQSNDGGEGQSPNQSGESRQWWHHVLTRDGADPIVLTPSKNYRFGRHEECEIRISSRKASRFHGQIVWMGSQASLEDLDSNNGTYLNDKRITSQILKDGDEVRIATFICTYRRVHELEEIEEDQVDSGALTTAGLNSMFSGHLHKTPLLEVLSTISHEGDTGMISVLPKKGQIGVHQGEPMWCYSQGLEGEEALLTMLLLESGMFVFTPKLEERARNITKSFSQILARAIERGIKPPSPGQTRAIRRPPSRLKGARPRPPSNATIQPVPKPRPTQPGFSRRPVGPRRSPLPETEKMPRPTSGVIRRPPRQLSPSPRPKPPPASEIGMPAPDRGRDS